MQFNLKTIPQYHIACKDLTHAIEIKHILQNFTKGAYELYTIKNGRKLVFKYGQTALEAMGERVYRQAWRVSGWPSYPAEGAAGADFDWVVNQFDDLDKNDLYITVYDISHVPATNPYRPEHETLILEGQLIKDYIDVNGSAPIGNRVENSRIQRGIAAVKTPHTPIYDVLHSFMDFK